MSRRELRIAILGAGIMGCSLALNLARRGARITLVDQAAAPMAAASRWNEGKIHLGYLYSGDPSLATARKLLPGSLAFRSDIEELIDQSLQPAVSVADDIYLTHRDSVVDATAMAAYFDEVSHLVRSHPDRHRYLADLTDAHAIQLSEHELGEITNASLIVAGFRVPERSVQTGWLADRLAAAVFAQRLIEVITHARVDRVVESDGRWRIIGSMPDAGRFDVVINSLWHGRGLVDAASGFASPNIWSYRYRLALFVRSGRPSRIASAVIATGPFGDIKNYNGRDLYLSWYPAGLVVNNDSGDPAAASATIPDVVPDHLVESILRGLGDYFPEVVELAGPDTDRVVAGGWVVAPGRGSLTDPNSDLHRRNRFGVTRIGSYYTIDTGKYATAPWLARRVTLEIMG